MSVGLVLTIYHNLCFLHDALPILQPVPLVSRIICTVTHRPRYYSVPFVRHTDRLVCTIAPPFINQLSHLVRLHLRSQKNPIKSSPPSSNQRQYTEELLGLTTCTEYVPRAVLFTFVVVLSEITEKMTNNLHSPFFLHSRNHLHSYWA